MWTYIFANKRINRGDINKLESRTRQIKDEILDQERGAESLRMEVGRMLLVVEAFRRVLLDKGIMTEEEFEQLLVNIDLEDGVRDGLHTQKKVPRMNCPQCGKINRKRAYCYSCGQPLHVKERVKLRQKACPECRHFNTSRATKCAYCGASLARKRRKAAAPRRKR